MSHRQGFSVFGVKWIEKRDKNGSHLKKKIFQGVENVSSEENYVLLDVVDSTDELEIDNFMNNSDTKFIKWRHSISDNYTRHFNTIAEANIHKVHR